MNIGIIGAENSHALVVARLLNVDKKIRGFKVTHLWGEKRAFSEKTAAGGEIPNVVGDPMEMVGQVDGIMIDHRDGKYHLPIAAKLIKAGVPVFVDKPMSTSLAEAKRFLALRTRLKVPVTTMSSFPLQPWTEQVKRELKKIGKLRVLHLCGPGEWKSRYGGIWFYGIHQTELIAELLGPVSGSVYFQTNGKDSSATIACGDGLSVSMNFLVASRYGFGLTAIGEKGTFESFSGYDPVGAERVARKFTAMFRTGKEPVDDRRMLAPLAVLDAMEKSIKTKKAIAIPKV